MHFILFFLHREDLVIQVQMAAQDLLEDLVHLEDEDHEDHKEQRCVDLDPQSADYYIGVMCIAILGLVM